MVLLRISKIRASQLRRWLKARAVSVLSDVKESICALSCSIDVLVSRQRLFQYCIYTYNKHTQEFSQKKKENNELKRTEEIQTKKNRTQKHAFEIKFSLPTSWRWWQCCQQQLTVCYFCQLFRNSRGKQRYKMHSIKQNFLGLVLNSISVMYLKKKSI